MAYNIESFMCDTVKSDTWLVLVNLFSLIERKKLKTIWRVSCGQVLIVVVYPERYKSLAGPTPGKW